MLEVIGAGFGRTGTLSLKHALELLDLGPCYHAYEVYQDAHVQRWRAGDLGVLDGYRATVDWPGCTYWRELMRAHPDAKVILSVRDPEQWWRSFDDTVGDVIRRAHRYSDLPWVVVLRLFTIECIEARSFGRVLSSMTRAEVIDAYQRHNAAVQREVPARRLLVHDVAEGWEPLCSFLGVPVPEAPFPRVNDRAEFHRLHSQHPRSPQELAALFAAARTRTSTC
jgi:hypothetical protein